MNGASIVLVIVALTGCGPAAAPPVTGPPAAPPPATPSPPAAEPAADATLHPGTGLALPPAFGSLRRVNIVDYESQQPGLGISVGYMSPVGAWATVYLYTMGHASLSNDLRSEPVVNELRRSVEEIHGAAAQGAYTDVSLNPPRLVAIGDRPGSPAAVHVSFTAAIKGQPIVSQLFLTTYRQHFVKVRVSYPTATRAVSRPIVERFLDELGAMLALR